MFFFFFFNRLCTKFAKVGRCRFFTLKLEIPSVILALSVYIYSLLVKSWNEFFTMFFIWQRFQSHAVSFLFFCACKIDTLQSNYILQSLSNIFQVACKLRSHSNFQSFNNDVSVCFIFCFIHRLRFNSLHLTKVLWNN